MNKKVFTLAFQARDKSNIIYKVETEMRPDGTRGGRMLQSQLATNFLDTPCVKKFNELMDIVESTMLVHACQGVNIESPAYVEGIRIAYEMCCSRSF